MGTVTQQLASAAIAEGVVISTGARVAEVEVEGGIARGVLLEDGRRVAAKAVVGGCGEFSGGAWGFWSAGRLCHREDCLFQRTLIASA